MCNITSGPKIGGRSKIGGIKRTRPTNGSKTNRRDRFDCIS